MKIKGEEILLPVSGVGSWPRPSWFKGKVFGTSTEPDYPSYAVREMFDDATRLAVDDQERLGFDIISDGQQYMECGTPYDYEVGFHHLPTRIGGTLPYGPPIAAFLTKVNQITVVDELQWIRPIWGPVMEVVSKYTTKPKKINVFTPAVLANVALHDKFYGDHEKLCYALADVYNAEFKDLVSRGLVDIIQFSDAVPDYVSAPWVADVINAATDGVDAQIWVHACQGNAGDRFLLEGGADVMFPDVYRIKMDLLHIALAHQLRAPDIDLLRRFEPPEGIALGAGVVDVKDPTPDKVETILERMDNVLKVMDPSRVVWMPDCGWMNRRRDTVWDKNIALVQAANQVRERYR